MSAEARLNELGIILPEYPKTVENTFRQFWSATCFTLAARIAGIPVIGKIGDELTLA